MRHSGGQSVHTLVSVHAGIFSTLRRHALYEHESDTKAQSPDVLGTCESLPSRAVGYVQTVARGWWEPVEERRVSRAGSAGGTKSCSAGTRRQISNLPNLTT